MNEDEYFMKEALKGARRAYRLGEVPIGCVIVRDGKIIARGYNRRKTDCSVLSHAELNAIKKACRIAGDWRLEDCELYVTLEPCQMCAGAIVQARIPRIIIGCDNLKAGSAGSIINLLAEPRFNHQVQITRGVLAEQSSSLLKQFFRQLREGNKRSKAIEEKTD
ncbi:MAG: tRNA adenosine(34) deaminase TadA [Lachnospiraceae bacterium]|nr:tRNA adenosine(34) deaminase TadA [Lachnospiraceae bacterium]